MVGKGTIPMVAAFKTSHENSARGLSYNRLRAIATVFANQGVELTGQEFFARRGSLMQIAADKNLVNVVDAMADSLYDAHVEATKTTGNFLLSSHNL